MSESTTTTDRLPASPDSSLPLIAAVAMVAWVALEFAVRRGLVPHLADVVGSSRGADALTFLFAFPLIAAVVAWWGMRNGIDRPDWDYETSLRTVGAGLGGVVVYFAVFVALAFVGKHLVVDLVAPPFRVTSLVVAAFVLCGLRARWGTTASTVAHLGMNLAATASVLVLL